MSNTTAAPGTAATVTLLLGIAGICPSPEEMAAYFDSYPGTRATLDAFYTVPGVRYEEPCTVFSAIPQI